MKNLDALLLRYAQPEITALAHLPKTYAPTVPSWAGQVTTLPERCLGAASGGLCDGWHVAAAAYGEAGAVRGTEAFTYLWRRFGPPWWGSDDHTHLVCYLLHTPHPAVFLSLALSASPLPSCVGYLVTQALQDAWDAPQRAWNGQFEGWWWTVKLNEQERAALRMRTARGPQAAPTPLAIGLMYRYWEDRQHAALLEEAEAALGPEPRTSRPDRHPDVCAAIHEALVECLRPVFIRDVAINILGHVPAAQLDDREAAERSDYAGYGIPRAALEALHEDIEVEA